MPTNQPLTSFKFISALCGLLGLCIGVLLIGLEAVNPKNIGWFAGGDPLVHFLSWEFFRDTPWTNPLGQNPAYGIEIASSIIYTDLVPLLALLFKPFSDWLPHPFQYLGIWSLICFGLQGYFGYLIGKKITPNKLAEILICILFIFSPIFLFRMGYHTALASQFLLLWAIYLTINVYQFWQWLALIVLSALINSYLLTMVMGLWLASFLNQSFKTPLTKWRSHLVSGIQVIVICSVILLIFWQSGYFTLPPQSYGIGGFGIQRMNLLSPINPQHWSYSIPTIDEAFGDLVGGKTGLDFYARRTESFQYLGTGVILLSLFALPAAWHIRSAIKSQLLRYQFLLCILFAFTLFALSNRIGFGHYQFEITLPEFIYKFASTWRASARFFWPAAYCWIIFVLWVIFRYYPPKKATTILLVCLSIQIVDSRSGWIDIHSKMSGNPSSEIYSPLQSPFWNSAPNHYTKLKIIPLRQITTQNGWDVFGLYALKHHLQTNISYLARLDANKVNSYNALINSQIDSGTYDRDTFYIVDEGSLPQIYRNLKSNDLLAKIDGYFVLAPGWYQCGDCPTIATMNAQLLDDRFQRPAVGEKVYFNKGGNGIRYINGGLGPNQNWAYPESWGTWIIGQTGMLTVPLPQKKFSLLELELYFPISAAHPRADFEIQPHYGEPPTSLSTHNGKMVIQIPIPSGARKDGFMVINLSAKNPIIPKEIGIGDDTRLLGIGLGSIIFK